MVKWRIFTDIILYISLRNQHKCKHHKMATCVVSRAKTVTYCNATSHVQTCVRNHEHPPKKPWASSSVLAFYLQDIQNWRVNLSTPCRIEQTHHHRFCANSRMHALNLRSLALHVQNWLLGTWTKLVGDAYTCVELVIVDIACVVN